MPKNTQVSKKNSDSKIGAVIYVGKLGVSTKIEVALDFLYRYFHNSQYIMNVQLVFFILSYSSKLLRNDRNEIT